MSDAHTPQEVARPGELFELSLDEVRAQMDPLGQALLGEGIAKAQNLKLAKLLAEARDRITELETQKSPATVSAVRGGAEAA